LSDPIRDELHRLSEEFKKLVGESTEKEGIEIITPDQLTKYGLTPGEAEAWFKYEPNFQSIRRIFTDDESDEDFTEPWLLRICFFYTF
jgi:hypothetical protein